MLREQLQLMAPPPPIPQKNSEMVEYFIRSCWNEYPKVQLSLSKICIKFQEINNVLTDDKKYGFGIMIILYIIFNILNNIQRNTMIRVCYYWEQRIHVFFFFESLGWCYIATVFTRVELLRVANEENTSFSSTVINSVDNTLW